MPARADRAAAVPQAGIPMALALQRAAGNRAVARLAKDPARRRMLARDVPHTLEDVGSAAVAGAARGVGDVIFGTMNALGRGVYNPQTPLGTRPGDDAIASLTQAQGDPVKAALFEWYRTGGGHQYRLTRAQLIESYRHGGYLNLFAAGSPLLRAAHELIAQLGPHPAGGSAARGQGGSTPAADEHAAREVTSATVGGQASDALGIHSVMVSGTLSAVGTPQRPAVTFVGTLSAHDWWDFDPRFGEMASGTSRRTLGGEAAVEVIHDVVRGQPFSVTSEPVRVQQRLGEGTATIVQ